MEDKITTAVNTTIIIITIIGLALVFLLVLLSCVQGNARWLAVLGIAMLMIGGAVYPWEKLNINKKLGIATYLCLLLLGVNLITGLLLYAGASPRPLTPRERNAIIAHLEDRHGDYGFRILSATSSNERLTGLHNLFSFRTFEWSIIEARAADRYGVDFYISGVNDGFNNIVGLQEEYGITRAVHVHRDLFQNRITSINPRVIERTSAGDWVRVEIRIDYSHLNWRDMDESQERESIYTIRSAIAWETGFDEGEIRVVAWYTLIEGRATFSTFGGRNYDRLRFSLDRVF